MLQLRAWASTTPPTRWPAQEKASLTADALEQRQLTGMWGHTSCEGLLARLPGVARLQPP